MLRWTGGVVHFVECLFSAHKALDLIPSQQCIKGPSSTDLQSQPSDGDRKIVVFLDYIRSSSPTGIESLCQKSKYFKLC